MFRVLAFILWCLSWSLPAAAYDPKTATACPGASETNRYLDVPLFYDIAATGAKISNINGFLPHPEGVREPSHIGKKIKLYFELGAPFDANKEIFFIIPGGPGSDHSLLHAVEKYFPHLMEKYNVVAMDHRGLGCSKPLFPGSEPYQALLMRYAAADIEFIRRELGGSDARINMWGGSYGSFLAQTYALLYPEHVGKTILSGAFSAGDDY